VVPGAAAASSGVEVMGVLNVTPDSFSDGGEHLAVTAATRRGLEMLTEGATVVDVGGESTRPGATPVDPGTEMSRVLPVVEALASPCAAVGARLSVDTRHEATARAAVACGATVLNDVSASLAPVAAELGVAWIAMHMAGEPGTMQRDPRYDDVVDQVRSFLADRADWARSIGVPEVWVDPGIGFGKTTAHNLALLGAVGALVSDGSPVVIGTSRKRFLGVMAARCRTGLPPHPGPGDDTVDPTAPGVVIQPLDVGERRIGSLVTAGWAMIHGARMVRVHEVAATVRLSRGLTGGEVGTGPG